MFEFRLPDIGEGLSEAELLEWRVKVGDEVKEGDDVASVSTDKVNVELPAPRSGKVAELCWAPGDIIPVGKVLMRLETDAAAGAGRGHDDKIGAEAPNTAISPAAQRAAPHPKVKASPAVRKKAKEHGVDLALITPTGANGFILPQDIDNYLKSGGQSVRASDGRSAKKLTLRGAKLTAAEKLSQSRARQVTTTIAFDVNADGIKRAVTESSQAVKKGGVKITPLAVIAKCVGQALTRHPRFNGVILEDENALSVSKTVDMGIAVAAGDDLIVPVIRDIASMDLAAIAGLIAAIAEKTRDGALDTRDVARPTFTLSSTGGFERAAITSTTPIINYPNVATLWASRIVERPRVVDGRLEAGPVLACSLSFDHRFLNGAEAIEFINTLDEILNQPAPST